MKFIINNNGNSASSIRKEAFEILRACRKLETTLASTEVCHGRNYQINEDPTGDREADLKMFADAYEAIDRIKTQSQKACWRDQHENA